MYDAMEAGLRWPGWCIGVLVGGKVALAGGEMALADGGKKRTGSGGIRCGVAAQGPFGPRRT